MVTNGVVRPLAPATVGELGVPFATPPGETPAGFRVELLRRADGRLVVDLVRDIGRDRNGVSRPTPLIFSVDSANPYDVVSYRRRFMRAARHVNEAQQASRLAGELQDTTV